MELKIYKETWDNKNQDTGLYFWDECYSYVINHLVKDGLSYEEAYKLLFNSNYQKYNQAVGVAGYCTGIELYQNLKESLDKNKLNKEEIKGV